MKRTLLSLLPVLALALPSAVFAKPVIGSVTAMNPTAGVPVTLQASVSSGAAIQKCTLWVDLAEVGEMTVASGVASREYTFASGGSRIAFVFCKDVNGEAAAGANTGINVAGSLTPVPLPTPTPTPVPTPTPTSTTTTVSLVGKLIKLACPTDKAVEADHPCKAVYYVSADNKRHAFPNGDVYFTWYANFDSVQTVSAETMASFMIGKNVTYKGGVKMVKFVTSPKVYAVARGGVLRGIASEEMAKAYYGAEWNKKIADISDAFFTNYTFGADIATQTTTQSSSLQIQHSKKQHIRR
ncbi:MAG: hypothetical protein U0487_02075 [Patescibacteria group bacterium]